MGARRARVSPATEAGSRRCHEEMTRMLFRRATGARDVAVARMRFSACSGKIDVFFAGRGTVDGGHGATRIAGQASSRLGGQASRVSFPPQAAHAAVPVSRKIVRVAGPARGRRAGRCIDVDRPPSQLYTGP